MSNENLSFDDWFNILQINVLEKTGIEIRDEDAFREDYESDRDVYDVIDEMVIEYSR